MTPPPARPSATSRSRSTPSTSSRRCARCSRAARVIEDQLRAWLADGLRAAAPGARARRRPARARAAGASAEGARRLRDERRAGAGQARRRAPAGGRRGVGRRARAGAVRREGRGRRARVHQHLDHRRLVVRHRAGDRGRGGAVRPRGATGERIQVEFVSANPTGPLHVGHARNAVLGDAIARLLETAGHTVEREYYFNDAGGQMDRFGASVEARYLQALGRDAEVPEDGYHGDYIAEYAADIVREHGDALADLPPDERLVRFAPRGPAGDGRDPRDPGAVRRGLRHVRVRGDARGARGDRRVDRPARRRGDDLRGGRRDWFRSTDYGDDKDRIVIRSNGRHTYFGADCAYLVDKFRRGFDHLIYVWGADHHGDVVAGEGRRRRARLRSRSGRAAAVPVRRVPAWR